MDSLLSNIFIHIINIGYQASIVIIFVILVRAMLNLISVPKKYIYLIWFIPFIRLAFPIQIESVFSILPNQIEPVPTTITMMEQPVIYTDLEIVNQMVNQSLPAATLKQSANPLQVWVFLLSVIWLSGSILLIVHGIISVIRIRYKLRASIHDKDNIYLIDNIPTAFVMGLYRTKIYLPSNISDDVRKYVICHERQHIERKDHIVKIIVFFLTCIYWFHPLVWVAYYLLNKDIEFACDEAVVENKDSLYRKEYATALLSLSNKSKRIAIIPLAFSEANPKGRIKKIINYKKPVFIVVIIGIITIVFVAIGLLTNPISKNVSEGGGTDSMENSSTESITDQPAESIIEVKAPEVDLSATVGADGARLYYVDEYQIIFGGYFGLFVYSKEDQSIVRGVDLKEIGCHFTQGDDYCEIFVSDDGATVYLHPWSMEEMYIYNVADNTLSKDIYNLDNIKLYKGTNEEGFNATYQVNGETKYCVISQYGSINKGGTIGSIGWFEEDNLFHKFFEPEEYRSAVYFDIEDIHDLIKIEMYIDGEIYSTEDEATLKWVENHFTKAEKIRGGSGCPFYDPMYLTRSDGQVGIIYPATDSCDIFQTANGYYDYGGGDNSEFWALFEGWGL